MDIQFRNLKKMKGLLNKDECMEYTKKYIAEAYDLKDRYFIFTKDPPKSLIGIEEYNLKNELIDRYWFCLETPCCFCKEGCSRLVMHFERDDYHHTAKHIKIKT